MAVMTCFNEEAMENTVWPGEEKIADKLVEGTNSLPNLVEKIDIQHVLSTTGYRQREHSHGWYRTDSLAELVSIIDSERKDNLTYSLLWAYDKPEMSSWRINISEKYAAALVTLFHKNAAPWTSWVSQFTGLTDS